MYRFVIDGLGEMRGMYSLFITGLSLSGDGASHNNIQFSSRHITTVPTDPACHPVNSFIGVHPELNHSAATQFEGWKDLIDQLCTAYNSHPDAECVVDPASVWQLAHGYLGDHAADQKKLSGKLEAYHRECDREVRGEDVILSDDPQDEAERDRLLDEKLEEMFVKAGGKECWASLPHEERLRQEKEVIREVQIALGEQIYQQLPPEEQGDTDFWAFSGCAMHKDYNAVKGGAERMAGSWEASGATPPIALMSKAQTADAESGSAPTKGNGGRRPERGGVKLTSLLGALVKHKNPNKGHQARFRVYCRMVLGFEVLFPDTSNNRYQSHGCAATKIIHHPQLYVNFLLNVQDRKATTGGLNHMEKNVLAGLTDAPTLTELQVLTLYNQVISLPFSQLVRTPFLKNGLDLGPEYTHLLEHLGAIIEDPDILIGSNVSWKTATLDGQPWYDPDVIANILCNRDQYPHLRSALIAFFEGALETWERFTRDILKNPRLSAATPEQLYRASREATNDINEGGIGMTRELADTYHCLTFVQINARLTCR